jgi:hypothetical protein
MYKYRVRAVLPSGATGNSNVITVTTPVVAPSAAVATDAAGISSSGFTANWNSVAGATGYQLDVSLDDFNTFIAGYNSLAVSGTTQDITGLSPNTAYQYRVRATNSAGASSNSNSILVTTLTSAPVATLATGISSSGFTVNWNSVAGANGYQLDISTDNFTTLLTEYDSKDVVGTTEIVTGLTENTAYQYRVRATNVTGASLNSNTISATTLTAAPTATAGTDIASAGFTAHWNAVTGAIVYQLDISTDNFTTFLTGYNSKGIAGTSQIVTGLTANTTYQYRVRATNATGASANSNVISVTTLTVAPVAAAATNISSSGFNANWNDVTGATSYELDISTDNFSSFVTGYNALSVSGTTQAVSTLTADVIYQCRVRAVNQTGPSANSNVIMITTLTLAPVAAAAGNISSTGFTASWNAVAGATTYELDISTDNFATFVSGYNAKIEASTSDVITQLTPATDYQYRVRAINTSGASDNSNVITATTLIGLPTAPVATSASSITSAGFTANWNSVADATSYQLDISTDNFTTFVTGYDSKNESNISDAVTGLVGGTTYQYRVRATNTSGVSVNSNTISASTSKADQTITFDPITDVTVGDAAFNLLATSSSGLAVSFSASSGNVTLSGNVVTVVSAGRETITATQPGNTNYNAASSVQQSFCIKPAKPTVTLSGNNSATVTLTSSAAAGNQWFQNGTAIPSATNNTLEVNTPGIYTVQSSADDCVSALSDNFQVIITGDIDAIRPLGLYPNPARDFVYVAGVQSQVIHTTVIDAVGSSFSIKSEREGNGFRGDVSALSSGVYILKVVDGSQVHFVRFVKL